MKNQSLSLFGRLKQKARYRKVIAVDFDGTLSLGKYPLCGPENLELTSLLRSILKHPVFERPLFLLWTSREGESLKNAVDWLAEIGIVFDSVNKSPRKRDLGDSRKIPADLYVDDRAVKPDDFIILAKTQGLL